MENDKALEILASLANGIDPLTRQPFPPDSPYQQADVVRALFHAIDALKGSTLPRKAPDPSRPSAGKLWTPEQEQRLRDAFAAHTPISQIAADHQRTSGAITARLIRLGLIEAPRHTAHPPNRAAPAVPAKDDKDFPF